MKYTQKIFISTLPQTMRVRAEFVMENLKKSIPVWEDGAIVYWFFDKEGKVVPDKWISSQGRYSGISPKEKEARAERKFMVEELREDYVNIANSIIEEKDWYIEHKNALEMWAYIQSTRTNICIICSEECKTHFHHIDKTLRPKYPVSGEAHIGWANADDILEGVHAIVVAYENKMLDSIIESTKYFGVTRNEVMELCPKCHRGKHSKTNTITK